MNQPSDKIKAKVLERLIKHLQNRNDVQNIDLMNLANFCRNCLAKWTVNASNDEISLDEARKWVYGTEYNQWKDKYQTQATPEQLEKFNNRKI